MIKKYKKKPVIIEAIQYNGHNKEEIDGFVGRELFETPLDVNCNEYVLHIPTLEGVINS